MKWQTIGAGVLTFWTSTFLLAQADPVDKNFGGAYGGGQLMIGQGFKAGSGTAGPAWLLSGDLGYAIKRDTWNRLELGVELGTGGISYEDHSQKVSGDVDLDLVAMIKGGYGYSLGNEIFGFFRVGAGMAKASLSGRAAGTKFDAGSATGLATMIGWDAVYSASRTLDLVGGVNFRYYNFNFKDVPSNVGSFQLNNPALYVGARVRL